MQRTVINSKDEQMERDEKMKTNDRARRILANEISLKRLMRIMAGMLVSFMIGATSSVSTTASADSAQSGSLIIRIDTLDDAGIEGASWQVDGGSWHNSGEEVSGLSVGSHTVSFSTVSGYLTPDSATISIFDGLHLNTFATYIPLPTGFIWPPAPQDYVKITSETYQDKLFCDSGNNCGTYQTGSFTINAVLFTGAGLNAASLTGDTPVKIMIGHWFYQGTFGTVCGVPPGYGANGKLSDDPRYKAKATRATLPLLYYDSNSKKKSAGTAILGFGKNSVTLAVTCKAGTDARFSYSFPPFIDADTLTGNPGPVSDTVSAIITIGNDSVLFTNKIVITGTDTVKTTIARDGSTNQLNTIKIKGVSQR